MGKPVVVPDIELEVGEFLTESPLFHSLTSTPIMMEVMQSDGAELLFKVTYFEVLLGYATIKNEVLVWE